jgi:spermidine synthase
MSGRFEDLNFEQPFVLQDGATRSLHFTIGEVQSSMRVGRPDELQVDYTRLMMGFLLVQPDPRHITMIGLGGGSLAKFCHRHLGSARIVVLENNPGVVALRSEFAVPDDDARLSVCIEDGALFIRRLQGGTDVLLVDGFDQRGQPPGLGSQAFYDDCHRALKPGGVLVVNLHVDDAGYEVFMQRIVTSFRGNVMCVVAREDRSNCIVFAARGRPLCLRTMRGSQWSKALQAEPSRELKGDFDHIGWNVCAVGRGA